MSQPWRSTRTKRVREYSGNERSIKRSLQSGNAATPASNQREPGIIGHFSFEDAVEKTESYGTRGERIQLTTNRFPVDVSRVEDLIPQYHVVVARVTKDSQNHERTLKEFSKCQNAVPAKTAAVLIQRIEKEEASVFGGAKIAYDGHEKAFVSRRVPWGKRAFTQVHDGASYDIEFTFCGMVMMSGLKEYLRGNRNKPPAETLTALDIILRTYSTIHLTNSGRGFCLTPEDVGLDSQRMQIGDGCEAWVTVCQAFYEMGGRIYLSMDVGASPFYIQQPAIRFAEEVLFRKQNESLSEVDRIDSSQIRHLENELTGVRVTDNTELHIANSYIVKGVTRESAEDLIISLLDRGQVKQFSVADAYTYTHGHELKFPHLPCLRVELPRRRSRKFMPLELAEIQGQQCRRKKMGLRMQRALAQVASYNPEERLKWVVSLLVDESRNINQYLEAFKISVSTSPVEIYARVLRPPLIQLGSNRIIVFPKERVASGSWAFGQGKLLQPPRKLLKEWGVLVLRNACTAEEVARFISRFSQQCLKRGLIAESHSEDLPKVSFLTNGSAENIERGLAGLHREVVHSSASASCQMLVVIKPDDNQHDYHEIKNVGDTGLLMPTQCLVRKTVISANEDVLDHIICKVNCKLGGVSWRIHGDSFVGLGPRFMVIGATVVHQTAYLKVGSAPSVAAMVSSRDKRCGRFAGVFRFQADTFPHIDEFEEMGSELLATFYEEHDFLPENFLIYRNGVPDSQFDKIIRKECLAFKAAAEKLAEKKLDGSTYKPRIAFIVAQHSSKTRFFPMQADCALPNGNCAPGTVIDEHFSSNHRSEFHLISHCTKKGTGISTRYVTLRDDVGMKCDDLQMLTYHLCYLYGASTEPIKVPAPLKYAASLSERVLNIEAARNFPRIIKHLQAGGSRCSFTPRIPPCQGRQDRGTCLTEGGPENFFYDSTTGTPADDGLEHVTTYIEKQILEGKYGCIYI